MSAVHRELAPAKLTRSLRVTGRRDDGYHVLEAEMVSLDLADELFIEDGSGLEVVDAVAWTRPAPDGESREDGPAPRLGVADGAENLVSRALELVGRRARVRLVKRIPPGAGLGGGSSDAAAILRWAGLTDPAAAAALGADVPFCVAGGRATVRGVGEVVEPLAYERFGAVLVTPPFGVSTPAVYRAWDELGGPAGAGGNDLEAAALAAEPRLARWRDLLSGIAGVPARLAGSGATWFVERDTDAAPSLADQVRGAVAAEGGRALVAAATSVPGH